MVKILKRLRNHHIALKASVICDKNRKDQVKHSRKNLLDIDSSPESDKSGFTEVSFDATRGRTFDHFVTDNLTRQVVKKEAKSKLGVSASENYKVSGLGTEVPVNKVYQIG
jgi:hypothetical protein